MGYRQLSDDYILRGFKEGDASIIRQYFYGYCLVGYNIFDQRYKLRNKENLDFMSLAHQYALYLMEHDWKPLEDRIPEISLRTWMINGFRYVVLDALKWYRKEYGSITYEDYIKSFDFNKSLRWQFNRVVEELCDSPSLSREDRLLIDMILLKGYKGKEVAEMMGSTPSAVSQRFKKIKEQTVIPYLKKYFDMDVDMPEVFDEWAITYGETVQPVGSYASQVMNDMCTCPHECEAGFFDKLIKPIKIKMKKRTTPDLITQLQPNEIFVFGSNLRGLHGGGAAYIAYRKFGAIMGQGVGLQGQSYGIPTMQGGVETIRPYVDEFIAFAKEHPELIFLVTRIGCGIAGFSDDEISPLFEEAHAIGNIVLPEGW